MLGEGKPLRRRGRVFPSPQAPLPFPSALLPGKRQGREAVAKQLVVWFETQCVSNEKGSCSPPVSPDRHKKTVSRRQRETVFSSGPQRARSPNYTPMFAACLRGRVCGTRRHSAVRTPSGGNTVTSPDRTDSVMAQGPCALLSRGPLVRNKKAANRHLTCPPPFLGL